jgi:hypothetical protein
MNMLSAPGRLLPLASLALAALGAAQGPLTYGNVVVVRVGDGSAPLTNASTPTFLDEYTPAGAFVQSIPLPTAVSGLNQPCTNSGTATSEGFLNVSTNGFYLLVGGYGVAPGTASVAASTNPPVPRVIARVDVLGQVDTTTALGDAYSTRNIRSVASDNGNRFWMTGSSEGIRHVANLGDTTSLAISLTPLNNRVVNIYNGQLYCTASSAGFFGVASVGTGLPTGTGQVSTTLNGFPLAAGPSAYDYFFANPNTLYVADDGGGTLPPNPPGIQKWTQSGGLWTMQYVMALGPATGCRGLTGFVQNGVTTLWATANSATSTQLVRVVDTGPGSVVTSIATPAPNTAFRGVRHLALPSTLQRFPHSCGAADIIATGNGQIGTDVITTILNPVGFGFIGYGVTAIGFPFCNCTIAHEFSLLLLGPSHTLSLPFNPTFIGIPLFIQGLDFLAPGGCPDPMFTLTDSYAFVVQ